MPRISAATNAAQRENTKRAILNSFGEILYNRGLSGLTMTDVAKNAGIGRTAVYNYFADMGELLVAYALDETERFLHELDEGITGVTNPIDQLAVYIRLQIEALAPTPGKDLVTLMTCTPYAVNSHRLLVTGERVPYDPATDPAPTTAAATANPVNFILNTITPLPWYMRLMGVASLGALTTGVVMAIPKKKRSRSQVNV